MFLRNLAMVFALALGSAWASQAWAEELIQCGSEDGRYNSCYVGHGYNTIRLVDRQSDAPCRPDNSFGVIGGVIWVDEGCRGIFAVSKGAGPNNAALVRCESQDGGFNSCFVGQYRLVEKFGRLSKASCEDNKGWGYDSRTGYIWVDYGCRADFYVE
jgi:hypothetical protein